MQATNEDFENEELLKHFGLAVFHAQALECQLVSLFAASRLSRPLSRAKVSVRELMDVRLKHTLGKLIQDAARELALEDPLTHLLEDALSERNWLVHHFYWEYAPAAFDQHLRRQAAHRLAKAQQLLENATDAVYDEVVRRYSAASGLSKDQIEIRSRDAIKTYFRGHVRPSTE